jgi:hypothetical protein
MEIPSNPLPSPNSNDPSDTEIVAKEAAYAVGEIAVGTALGWFIFGPVGAVLGGLAGSLLYKATRT